MASGLSQDDFRRLMETPRAGGGGVAGAAGSDAAKPGKKFKKKRLDKATLKLLEEKKAKEKELADKYRDRAAERRAGENRDYADDEALLDAYKSAAAQEQRAEADEAASQAERRRREIEESKFLGGDMEHTHLVKGLDYALLQKVKSEMDEVMEDDEDEADPDAAIATSDRNRLLAAAKVRAASVSAQAATAAAAAAAEAESGDRVVCRSRVAQGVYNTLFQSDASRKKHELFQPGRMAYLVDLENKSRSRLMDAPTTVVRSKTDCPETQEMSKATTNDIVVEKLCQILSYLRQGERIGGKRVKKVHKSAKRRSTGDDDRTASGNAATDPSPAATPARETPDAAAIDIGLDIYGDVDDVDGGAFDVADVADDDGGVRSGGMASPDDGGGAPVVIKRKKKKASYFASASAALDDDAAGESAATSTRPSAPPGRQSHKMTDAAALERIAYIKSVLGDSTESGAGAGGGVGAGAAGGSADAAEGAREGEAHVSLDPVTLLAADMDTGSAAGAGDGLPGGGKLNRRERRKQAQGSKSKNRLQPLDEIHDGYNECYPGGMDMMVDAYDSDEEGARKDEEEQTEKKSKVSAKDRKGKETQKLNNELSAINKFIEKRKAATLEKAAKRTKTD